MESNRDEAERCIAIAAQAIRDAKIEKAEKFLKKAEKLFPSQKAKGKVCACGVDVYIRSTCYGMCCCINSLLKQCVALGKVTLRVYTWMNFNEWIIEDAFSTNIHNHFFVRIVFCRFADQIGRVLQGEYQRNWCWNTANKYSTQTTYLTGRCRTQ